VALGHKRLSIIDLSERGREPMWNEDRSLCLLANGEIYNFKALRSQLVGLGHRFSSDTDVEVVVHGFEEWGPDVFPRLRGMFALALYRVKEGDLHLARDPIGIKPLYLIEGGGWLAFASEARAFQALPAEMWNFALDDDSLDLMLRFQYLPDSRKTLLRGVSKLPPAHYLRWTPSGVERHRYWNLDVDTRVAALDFAEAEKECEQRLTESVLWTLNADVPVGILLSGGLDSSLVAALASRFSGHEVSTYTATFDHQLDESDAAQVVARHLGTRHTPIFIDAAEVNRRFEEIVPCYDDLTSFDGGLFTLYLLAERIREHGIKVLLFGDGADEAFAGYSWFGLCQAPFRFLPAWVRNRLQFYAMTRMLPGWTHRRHVRFLDEVVAGFAESDICRQVGKYEVTVQLPNHFNMKTDKAISAQSLEARVPYLDHELVRFAYSLPAPHKFHGRWFDFHAVREKHILRRIAARYLPAETALRKKRGFLVPVAEILKSNADKVRGYLLDEGSVARRFFGSREMERMLGFRTVLYSPIEKQKEFLVWKFFLLETWRRGWQDGRGSRG
jgi:asparagine synthase (glutamine-hydrolysing)